MTKKQKTKEQYNLSEIKWMIELFKHEKNSENIKSYIRSYIKNHIIEKYKLNKNIVFIYDIWNSISDYTSNRIYEAISELDSKKDEILLSIHSWWWQIEPAYLISKCCKEFSKKFTVCIPRKAKSAATLISLWADEIHMWQMSHLWPIDPQINWLPALWLSDAVDYLANLTKRFPEASDMIASYLSKKLDLQSLWYFERVSESAIQYWERLLKKENIVKWYDPRSVSSKLVYWYKDHWFVIDYKEINKFLSNIKKDTNEYKIWNDIHEFLENIKFIANVVGNFDFKIIWNIENWISLIKKEEG